jgi:hypothetical protein
MLDVTQHAPGRGDTLDGLLRLVVADVDDVLAAAEHLWGWTRQQLLMVEDQTRGGDLRVQDRRVLTLVLTRCQVTVGDLVRDWYGHSDDGFRRLRRKAEEQLATNIDTRAAVTELVAAVMAGSAEKGDT